MAINLPKKAIQIIFLDFRKPYDLIDYNKLLETFTNMEVRQALIGWFASYFHGRSQATTIQGEQSDRKNIHGGIP